ncbi:MAG TPA: branched-chain amino acid ABC transporter permease [Acidimicrobiia bacterium]|jgi:branched-chain amino acid transport system permease protein|nr:branched-chain amino acid ABC transporter permease [Acidimicrobiia bacterium]
MSNIGVDRWVAESSEHGPKGKGWTAPARSLLDRVPSGWKLLGFLVVAAVYPFLVPQAGVRIGITALLLAMLAIGLNTVVGWAGLLDLGYIAFYGFGAYFYGAVSSDQIGVQWPTWVAIPVIVLASAVLGALLSLPSRRLVGDYLAIMTLFFAQVFLEVIVNYERLPGVDTNLTGGPNGIIGVQPWQLFGFPFDTFNRNYFLLLVLLGLVIVLLRNIDQSRTGRAWRALREDTLAAAHMTTPVNRLKMLAFAVGAAVAGLTGTVLGPVQVGVFPNNFQLLFLITIYAALILGGLGSIPGAVLGAIAVAFTPEILRNPGIAGWLFYIGVVVLLVTVLRRWRMVAAVLAGVVVLGYLVRFLSLAIWDETILGAANDTFLSGILDGWLLILGPASDVVSNYAFVLALAGVLAVTVARGWRRGALLVPTIYLAILVWENKLSLQDSVTRQLLFGAVLVVMMAVRPEGILGTRRVEIT